MLTDAERRTLRALCDAVVPALARAEDPHGFLARRGSDLDLPALIEEGLAETPEHLRAQFRRLLRVMGSRAANLVLGAGPRGVAEMSASAAEAYLRSWGTSRLPLRRAAFQALKQVITFLFYASHPAGEPNPNWPAIGFPGHPPVAPGTVPGTALGAASGVIPRITPLEVASDAGLEADVCVIGSGAGGSVAAAELSRAGRQVLIVERGGYYDQGDYNGDEYEMLRRLSLGKGLFGTADNAFGLLAATCLGGSTVVNWCTSLRPAGDVLEEWGCEHGIDGASGPEFLEAMGAVEARLNVNTLESGHNPNNQVLADGARALGYRLETIPRNVRGCDDCGPCVYGCARGAKQDALVTYLRDACGHGARVLVRCRAERVLARSGEVTGVEAVVTDPASGQQHRVAIRCRTVVVAGGAIFSPALLLRSGLGNTMVGRGLRLHPVTACLGLYPHPIRIWAGAAQTATCTEFTRVRGMHGFWIEASPGHPGLSAMALPWVSGEDHKRQMARLEHTAALIVLVRDSGSGRVGLTPDGHPLVRYALNAQDRALMLQGLEEMGKIHFAAGAQEVASLHTRGVRVRREEPGAAVLFADGVRREGIRPNALALFSAHLMGGLPMGSDSRLAAVDPSGGLYGVRNLFVADASLFPSAPGVNPMIAIMAMAYRVARRIASDQP
ncbi:MAG: FAD-dependent oxidoreductase [Armatimonadetes bacterium]|nr:FAD-dependent oxidoreductase [Armatimonadota bacterium]